MKRVLAVLFFAVTTSAMPTPVQDLPASCTYNSGATCAKTYDSTSGVCRTIRFSTSAGEIQVLVCDKTDHYELYRQSYPSGIPFKACVGGGSVDQISGFSSFTSTAPGSGTPLIDPNSIGFGNQTRAVNHATMVGAWWDDSRVIQRFPCTYGWCAWVPWYLYSHSCEAAELQPLSKCGGSGTATISDNCMVTDQFSQVFLATAQGENGTRVKELFNTLRLITSGGHGGLFETLPVWSTRRSGQTLTAIGTRDSASDADARVLLALYVAASSPFFAEADRAAYRAHANAMAADFLEHDFFYQCRPGRNGGQICHWLASGGNAANGGLTSNNFTFAGYHGDAVIALLAAYRALNDAKYRDAAADTVNAYLLASDYSGSFRVPPKAFRWDLGFTPQRMVCTDTCNGEWDYDDAPRVTTICKAKYYAQQMGVTLPSDLDTYCTAWRNRGGLTSTAYRLRYAWNGTPLSSFDEGPYANGLGASLDFAYSVGDLTARIDRVGTKWDGSHDRWYNQTCLGVYHNAFFPTNLGSAIGRDLSAFR